MPRKISSFEGIMRLLRMIRNVVPFYGKSALFWVWVASALLVILTGSHYLESSTLVEILSRFEGPVQAQPTVQVIEGTAESSVFLSMPARIVETILAPVRP